MFSSYLTKVRAYLGGFRNDDEVELVRACFNRHLTPSQAATVVENSRA